VSAKLDEALCALDRRLGYGVSTDHVVRVDVRNDGGLVLTVEERGTQRWFVATTGVLIEVHPQDELELPLCQAVQGEIASGALGVLAWRPGRRIVLIDRRNGRPRVLKGYRKARSARPARTYEALEAALGPRPEVRVPRLVEHSEPRARLEFEYVEGGPLRIQHVDEDSFGAVGRFLADLSRLPAEKLKPFGPAQELEVLDAMRQRVTSVRLEPEGWAEARTILTAAFADSPATELLPGHRDLHDGQLSSHERRVALLDFDLACLAEPALDLGNLSAHMQLRVLQGLGGASQRGADLCAKALVEGRGLPGTPEFLARLRLYQASTFLRLALLYSIRPRWARLTPTLIAFARRSLEDAVPV